MTASYGGNPVGNFGISPNKLPNEVVKNKKELGQEDFMKLMLTQLKSQDPTNPQSNADFIAQMAQFSQLDGMTKLNESFDKMTETMRSSQALQASAMVGHGVQIPANVASYQENKKMTGSVVLPAETHNVRVSILNSKNELITQMALGDFTAGAVPFTWNGTDMNGNKVPEGQYKIAAEGSVNGRNVGLGTMLEFNVDSVSVGGGRVFLNLDGHGSVDMSDVRKIS